MKTSKKLCLIGFYISLCGATSSYAKIDLSWQANGLKTLNWNDNALVQGSWDGVPVVQTIELEKSDGTAIINGDAGNRTTSRGSDSSTLFFDHNWGRASHNYQIHGDTLRFTITLKNTHATNILTRYWMRQIYLRFPEADTLSAQNTAFNFHQLNGNIGADPKTMPVAFISSWSKGSITMAMTDGNKNVSIGLGGRGQLEKGYYRYTLGFDCKERVAPGTVVSFVIDLRFGPKSSNLIDMAKDVFADYSKAHPQKLNWPDRRPFGLNFLASTSITAPNNPSRWIFLNDSVNLSIPAGLEFFREALIKKAQTCILNANKMNAQAIVTWDIEGQPKGPGYYGDPRKAGALSPEMDYKGNHAETNADIYFKTIREAGLRVGVCIRPQRLNKDKGFWQQEELTSAQDRIKLLQDKIQYCKTRWGVSIFYIDSDGDVSALDYKVVAEAHPDVLLMPEWDSPLHYAYTAPFITYQHFGQTGTPSTITAIWPKAFSCNMINMPATKIRTDWNSLLKGVKSGDILMNNCWYAAGEILTIDSLYKTAGIGKPPTSISDMGTPKQMTKLQNSNKKALGGFFDLLGRPLNDYYPCQIHRIELQLYKKSLRGLKESK